MGEVCKFLEYVSKGVSRQKWLASTANGTHYITSDSDMFCHIPEKHTPVLVR